MLANDPGPRARRGVTLIEMLVTLAVLLIIMTILVQIFQAATGAVSAAQTYQQLDDQLRRVDGLIRGDLEGVTARFTPPLDPALNLGYFEYGENEFADSQGEDSDDYIRFTAKAPPDRPFTGRLWVSPSAASYNASAMPITITSEFAEIIYFLRNGNLYRRVLLVAPERQGSLYQMANNKDANGHMFYPTALGGNPTNQTGNPVSWQGVNDLSARPAARGGQSIILNSLGDLTNRENRFASPRFADDFLTVVAVNKGLAPTWSPGPDGLSDDQNDDNAPDLYPTLYPSVFNTGLIWAPPAYPSGAVTSYLAFPFIFPGAYSRSQDLPTGGYGLGWIHSPTPTVVDAGGNAQQFDGKNPLSYLQYLNHNPLDLGDNLPPPSQNITQPTNWQTWWGFPTWRETLSPLWNDPTIQVNTASSQPTALNPLATTGHILEVSNGYVDGTGTRTLLPPMTAAWRVNPQLFTDGFGSTSNLFTATNAFSNLPQFWSDLWEDDLIMTGVRSFDIKAYDNALASYADLGWGDDLRSSGFTGVPFLLANPDYSGSNTPTYPPLVAIQGSYVDYINTTFAHEGRMPPLIEDNRLDAQFPNLGYTAYSVTPPQQYSNITDSTTGRVFNFTNYTSNIGDDQAIVRLRRVWDSWSTAYTRAPATGVYLNASNPPDYSATPPTLGDALNASPWGPPFTPPIYPSYPPPYPAPLRGIQIQIRIVDPTNQRIKSLTIRQDFTDKL